MAEPDGGQHEEVEIIEDEATTVIHQIMMAQTVQAVL